MWVWEKLGSGKFDYDVRNLFILECLLVSVEGCMLCGDTENIFERAKIIAVVFALGCFMPR